MSGAHCCASPRKGYQYRNNTIVTVGQSLHSRSGHTEGSARHIIADGDPNPSIRAHETIRALRHSLEYCRAGKTDICTTVSIIVKSRRDWSIEEDASWKIQDTRAHKDQIPRKCNRKRVTKRS